LPPPLHTQTGKKGRGAARTEDGVGWKRRRRKEGRWRGLGHAVWADGGLFPLLLFGKMATSSPLACEPLLVLFILLVCVRRERIEEEEGCRCLHAFGQHLVVHDDEKEDRGEV